MDFLITLSKPWPYRHPKRGRSMLQPGRYRVPEDVDYFVAERAVAEGMATREAAFGAMFRPPSSPAKAGSAPAPAAPVKRSKRGPKKRKPKSADTGDNHSVLV